MLPFDQIAEPIWAALDWFATGGDAAPPPTSTVRAAVGLGLLYGGAVPWALRRLAPQWSGVWITNLGLAALHWRAALPQPPRAKGTTRDEEALALFLADTSRTKTDLARQLELKNPQSLSPKRCPKLTQAMRAWREANAGQKIRGTKDKDGNLEAWEDE
jgi:hypothetical protein